MLISNEVFPKTEGSAPALGLLLLFLKGFYKNVPAWALQKGRGPPPPVHFPAQPAAGANLRARGRRVALRVDPHPAGTPANPLRAFPDFFPSLLTISLVSH